MTDQLGFCTEGRVDNEQQFITTDQEVLNDARANFSLEKVIIEHVGPHEPLMGVKVPEPSINILQQ